MNTLSDFRPGQFYHVFNRTNNKELLFRTDENKRYFLQQYIKYVSPFVQTYAYILLPTHFHFLISINSISELKSTIQDTEVSIRSKVEVEFEKSLEEELCHKIISTRFSRLFTSYTLSYNKLYKRHGNLFSRRFKRSRITNENKFGYLQFYIHRNIEKHGIDRNWEKYAWSSYNIILSEKETFLNRAYVVEYFGCREQFITFIKDSSFK
ncbi:MAG: hypothetical protein KDC80_21860 [Saprospiraceae bacterium]|nr:hypothetical protein [Saprospiraceae bacterium]